MKKKIGIIGFGEMGKRHGLEFREATHGLIELTAVVEPDDVKYKQGCKWNYLDVPRFATVEEMLDKCKLDGVLITSPNFMHLENLESFAGKNIPILLEKPLDTNMENIAKIVRFAKDYEGKIVVDHVMRYAPIIRKAKQMIDDGMLGKVCSFQFTQRLGCGPFHTFRRSQKTGGAQIIEKATHDIDVALFLTNSRPERVAMISKQQVLGGNKSNDLHCSSCPDILTCPHAVTRGMKAINGFKDVDISNDMCVLAKEVDIPDNETCIIELDNNIFGSYSQTYFVKMLGHSRIYEIIGSKGAIHMTLSHQSDHHGKLKYFPSNNSGEVELHDFDYNGKIHYDGGQYIGRHFYNLMCGIDTYPFTSVNQAFVAEALGLAALEAATNKNFMDIVDVVPEDLKSTYMETY